MTYGQQLACTFLVLAIILSVYLYTLLHLSSEGFNEPLPLTIMSIMRAPFELQSWLSHHRSLGVASFYIQFENMTFHTDVEKSAFVTSLGPDVVTFFSIDNGNRGSIAQRQTEFAKQVKESLLSHKKTGWIFLIDNDELLHGSLKFLESIDQNIIGARVSNFEARYSDSDMKGKSCFSASTFVNCKLGGCRGYAVGKTIGRLLQEVDIKVHNVLWKGQDATEKLIFNVPDNTLKILHFESCDFLTWFIKFEKYVRHEDKEVDWLAHLSILQ